MSNGSVYACSVEEAKKKEEVEKRKREDAEKKKREEEEAKAAGLFVNVGGVWLVCACVCAHTRLCVRAYFNVASEGLTFSAQRLSAKRKTFRKRGRRRKGGRGMRQRPTSLGDRILVLFADIQSKHQLSITTSCTKTLNRYAP